MPTGSKRCAGAGLREERAWQRTGGFGRVDASRRKRAVVKDRIAKSVFWLTWSRITLQVVSLLATVFVARLLHPADYGLMALAGILTGVVALLSELGLSAAVVQFRDLDERQLNSCFWITLSVAIVGYAGIYVAAPFIATWFDAPLLTNVLRVASLSLVLLALRVVPDGLLRRQLELDKVSRAEVM